MQSEGQMEQLLSRVRGANSAIGRGVQQVSRSFHTTRRAQTLAVAACAVLVSLLLTAAFSSARHARYRWTATSDVLVTTTWTRPGDTLGANNTSVQKMPAALVPADALTAPPNGSTLRVGLGPNTALTESMVAGAQGSVSVPDNWRVVAMGADVTAPVLVPGDKVDVVSADRVLAASAIVTAAATDAQGPTIAVPADAAAVVATAARLGEASLVLAS